MAINFKQLRNELLQSICVKPSDVEPSDYEFPIAEDRIYNAIPNKAILTEKESSIGIDDEILLEDILSRENAGEIPVMSLNGDEVSFIVRRYYNPDKYSDFWFHLTECKHIKNVVQNGKIIPRSKENFYSNFYISNRHDGQFETKVDGKNVLVGPPHCKVCRECYNLLKLYKQFGSKSPDKFNIYEYYMKNSFTGKHYLSAKKNNSNRYSYFYKTYLAEELKKLSGGICERCGRKFDINHLEVHHKNRDKSDNSMENLEVLCEYCHDKEHPCRPSAIKRYREEEMKRTHNKHSYSSARNSRIYDTGNWEELL